MGELPDKQEKNRKRRGNAKWKPGQSQARRRNGFCPKDVFFISSVSKNRGKNVEKGQPRCNDGIFLGLNRYEKRGSKMTA